MPVDRRPYGPVKPIGLDEAGQNPPIQADQLALDQSLLPIDQQAQHQRQVTAVAERVVAIRSSQGEPRRAGADNGCSTVV